jgi:hypothetical protein
VKGVWGWKVSIDVLESCPIFRNLFYLKYYEMNKLGIYSIMEYGNSEDTEDGCLLGCSTV